MQNRFTIASSARSIADHPSCQTKFANGCPDAYSWVYIHYSRRVYNYALMLTRNESISEDIVQEVFYILWMKRSKLKAVKDFDGYFFVLCRNHVYNVLRKYYLEKKARRVFAGPFETSLVEVEELLLYKETKYRLLEAERQLSSEHQLVFWLSRDKGWKRKDIASYMGSSAFSIKGQLQTALKKLKTAVTTN